MKTFQEIRAAALALSLSDRERLLDALWESIPIKDLVSPDILREARRRSAELKANPEMSINEEELWRRVDGNSGLRQTDRDAH